MKKKEIMNQVKDYWKFTRELKAQLNAIKVLECQFFGLEELCELSIKNNATCLNDKGERVSVVSDCFDKQQAEIYHKLHKAIRDLDVMLESGKNCFRLEDEGN